MTCRVMPYEYGHHLEEINFNVVMRMTLYYFIIMGKGMNHVDYVNNNH